MTDPGTRIWGWTTGVKLGVLKDYLRAFTTASQRAGSTVYLDAFAGGPSNVQKETAEEFDGSARIALDTQPSFTTLRYFEMGPKAALLRSALQQDYPGRDLEVIEGDCNKTIPAALQSLNPHAPTFAFIDPDGMEVRWPTLVALANHKRHNSKYKVELWMLFTASGLQRTLCLNVAKLTQTDIDRADRLYGSHDWWPIYDMRRQGQITGGQAREELVNLMRWRLENELGYKYTHAIEMKRLDGVPLYHMVFATDNEAGNKIMSDLYRKAYDAWPQMREMQVQAEEHSVGKYTLFEAAGEPEPDRVIVERSAYRHEPPWTPPGLAGVD